MRTIARAAAARLALASGRQAGKEELILAILAEARCRESALLAEAAASREINRADLIGAVWSWASAPERSRFMRLFFEVCIQSVSGSPEYSDQAQAMVTDWLTQFARIFSTGASGAGPAEATLLIAVLRGLLLDQLSTGDTARTTRAMERFVQLLSDVSA